MSHDNNGSQSGDNSLNVGVGDFRGANVNINQSGRPVFTPEVLQIVRHPAFGGLSLQSQNVSIFGIVTGVGGLLGLYTTLFPLSSAVRYSSWSTFFMFCFIVGMSAFVLSVVLRRRRFEHLFSDKYMEITPSSRIQINRLTALCPWCQAGMRLWTVGPKEGPKDHQFICQRNPRQHTVELDPTMLPSIKEPS
jgi:hypothetical protein